MVTCTFTKGLATFSVEQKYLDMLCVTQIYASSALYIHASADMTSYHGTHNLPQAP
jgi:hypothetical protein